MSKKSQRRHRHAMFHRRTPPGAAPGTLIADPLLGKPVVRVMAFGPDQCTEHTLCAPADYDLLPKLVEQFPVTWVNVEGLGDADVVSRLGKIFNLHALALEDVLNTHQRSKIELYGEHLFIVVRMLEGTERLESDQLGMFLGKRFIVTFQHTVGDCLDPLRERIRHGRGIVRTSGPDYLAYAVIDAVVDSYFPILETFGEQIETLEDAIIADEDGDLIARIHDVKSKLLLVRRAVWPLREALNVLVRDPIPLVHPDTRIYLRDCADHTFQIMDLVDTYRELTSDLMGLYHSSLSNRMNEIMQVLTVIATIFIPLTFIVGVYGMNFNTGISPWNMPELNWYWGYPIIWVIMLVVTAALMLLFHRKGWLPRGRKRKPSNENGEGGEAKRSTTRPQVTNTHRSHKAQEN
ncbi:MAG: magnesium/cobalt transporter CorA [Pirellulales bacterium]